MYDFILRTVIMISLAIMVYLAARAVPRVGELITPNEKKSRLEELLKKIPWHKIDILINSLGEKFLRRLKIISLKIDNLITKYLSKFRRKHGSQKTNQPSIFDTKSENSNPEETNNSSDKN